MKGSIQSLPVGHSTGQIEGIDGVTYVFYPKDFSPEDFASGLEEMESVEFEAVHGDVNRAMHCVRLRNSSAKTDVLSTAEPGGATAAVKDPVEDLPPLYAPPTPAPLLCKGELPPEWEIISISDWCVRGSSHTSTDEARHLIAQRARELKANAILNLEYGISGAGDKASKTQFFQGRLAIVGRKDPKGKPREMLVADLNQAAKAVLQRLELRRLSMQRQNYALYAACTVLTLAAGAVIGFTSLPTLIVAAIALGLGVKLTKDTRLDPYVTLMPMAPAKPVQAAR